MARRTVSTLIDDIRTRLGDSGNIVSRAEILEHIEDGYGRIVREANTPCMVEAHDIPPRVEYAVTHEWERELVRGTTRKFTLAHQSGRYDCTYLHETSTHAGQTSATSKGNVTQLHMLEYVSDTPDIPYRLAMPRRHDILAMWYDHRLLLPVAGASLEQAGNYWDIEGLPGYYSTDETHNEVDIYRIETDNQGAYQTDRPVGVPRHISGDRTWEVDERGEAGVGIIREIVSPDRQYWNSSSFHRVGTIRSWASSEDNLMVYSAVEPERNLSEGASLDMVPPQLEKYIKFWALAMIHNRQGELYEPNMAEHYRMRYRRGVQLLSKIRNVAYRDTDYGRDPRRPRSTPARPQLPDNYPRLRW